MELTITWIRHGESEWNAQGLWQGHSESPLSERGREQARALGRRLASGGYRFDKVYSSDLSRANETARIALPQADILVDSRLREINFGVFEGLNHDKIEGVQRDELTRWWKSPYDCALSGGGESMKDLRARVGAWRDEQEGATNIAVFTHGGVIRDALWRETSPPVDGAWSFFLENTGITVVSYSSQRNLIRRVNDHAHLESSIKDSKQPRN